MGYNFLTGGVVLNGKQDGIALLADRPLNTFEYQCCQLSSQNSLKSGESISTFLTGCVDVTLTHVANNNDLL